LKPEQQMVREIPRDKWQEDTRWCCKRRTQRAYQPINTDQIDPQEYSNAVSYVPCEHCKGEGVIDRHSGQFAEPCPLCDGNTAFGVSPQENRAWPGTPEKVAILAARYAQGLPLHREDDIKVNAPSLEQIMDVV